MPKTLHAPRREASGTGLATLPPAPPVHPNGKDRTDVDAGPVEARLARLLDTPHLARLVPHLPAEALHQLIRYQGIENCGALLAATTTAQLGTVLDLDLWRSTDAGRDEQFDLARFGEWLEGLMEGGDVHAAAIVSRIDGQLAVMGLSGYIRVFDPATVSSQSSTRDDAPDGVARPAAGLSTQVGGYVVLANGVSRWDAIVALLFALEANHRAYFHTVMRGCRWLSQPKPETDGLDNLLAAPEQLLYDIATSRNDRRSERGYLTPPEARAFLQMAIQPHHGPHRPPPVNPIVAAYLRSGDEAAAAVELGARPAGVGDVPSSDADEAKTVEAVLVLLDEATRAPEGPRALLGRSGGRDSRVEHVRALMEVARVSDEPAFRARSREVAFLANALMAGCSVQARRFTAQEASDAAIATCDLGIELWPSRWPDDGARGSTTPVVRGTGPSDSFLSDHDLVTAFQVGWAALHEASLFVAQQLLGVLKHVRALDTKTHGELVTLRRKLTRCCKAGAPWLVRDALDVLAILDTTTWTALVGTLDECPVVTDALTALLERRTGAVSATAFEFVSSGEQIEEIHTFAQRLPGLLGP
jgi:hypothetical protein